MTAGRRREAASSAFGRGKLVLEIGLDPLSFSLRHPLPLAGFGPRALTGEGILRPGRAEIVHEDEAGLRIRARDARLVWDLDLRFDADGRGFSLDVEITARGEGLIVHGLEPFHWSDALGPLDLPGTSDRWRFFRMGYQSWSPAGFDRVGARADRPRLPLARIMHFGPLTPLPSRARHVSDFVASIGLPEHRALTLGFLSHRRHLTHVSAEHARGRIASMSGHVSTPGRRLGAGDTLAAETFWLGVEPPLAGGLSDWAQGAGRAMGARFPARPTSGWCSWYQFFTRVDAEDVRRNLRALESLEPRVETVQIDDGFQRRIGDWLEPSAGFPDGIAPLAREIRGAGFRAGLWLAPFLVARGSRLLERHPEWLVRHRSGRPRLACFNPAWPGRVCYALDGSRPEVREWLETLGTRLREMGFDYLKLDFLYAGTLAGSPAPNALPAPR